MARAAPVLLAMLLPAAASGQGFLDQVQEQVSGLQKQAEGMGDAISQQLSPVWDSARDATGSAVEELKHGSEKAAAQAVLWASGHCADIRGAAAEVPEYLAPKLAEAFASSTRSPAGSPEDCADASRAGLEEVVDEKMAGDAEQERMAVKLVLGELAAKVCTHDLMEALETMEAIRSGYKEQYRMAISDRLRYRVLTEEALTAELAEFCGGEPEPSQLFSDQPLETSGTGASAPSLAVLLSLSAALAAVATGAIVARRCRCSFAQLLLGEEAANAAEQGLIFVE